ncbi:hypothetical protein BGZ76_003019 [Entomortierella beljakovae]|nr:hypothetical protein BGZ76_003019 [Entomortierella beljakovae]
MERIRDIVVKYPDPTLPLRDINVAREVAMVTRQMDFTMIYPLANVVAGIRVISSPTMCKILVSTKQSAFPPHKRLADEDIIHSEIGEIHARRMLRELRDGCSNPAEDERDEQRATQAIAKINYMHSFYPIKDSDILYNVGAFTTDLIWWLNNFGWRDLEEIEKYAIFAYWRNLGYELGLKYIPGTLDELSQWTKKYMNSRCSERCHAASLVNNARIDLMIQPFPSFLHPFLRKGLYGFVPQIIQVANGWSLQSFDSFPTLVCRYIIGVQNFFIRNFTSPRKQPMVNTSLEKDEMTGKFMLRNSHLKEFYPDGYHIQDVGPKKFQGRCPFGMDSIAECSRLRP